MRFLVLFFLFSQFILAQNSKLDSIQNLLLSPISLEDRVDIYHKLSYYYLPQDYDLSVLYADSSYRFSISLGDTFRIADAIDLYAKLKLRRGDSDSARYYYSQYENLFGGFSNSAYIENEAFLLGELGVLFFYKSNFDSALYYFEESIEKNTILNNQNVVARMQSNIGSILYHQEQYDQALQHFKSAQLIFEGAVKDTLALLNVLNNTGLIFHDLEDYPKAISYFERGIHLANQVNSDISLEMLFLNLGSVYFMLDDFEVALNYFEQSLAIKKKNKIPFGINLERIASVYFKTGFFNKSKERYLAAIAEFNKYEDEIHIFNAQLGLADVYEHFNQNEKALYLLEEVLRANEVNENKSNFLSIYKQLMHLSFLIEDIDRASLYSSLFLESSDSINNLTIRNKVYEVEHKHQLNQKQNEFLILQQQSAIDTYYWQKLLFGVLFLFLLILLVLMLIIFRSRVLAKNLLVAELQNTVKNKEILNNTMLLAKQKEAANIFINDLKELKKELTVANLALLEDKILNSIRIEYSWDEYLKLFNSINPGFHKNLKNKGIELSSSEKRLCALVSQGHTINEIANITSLLPASVGKARIRLRKKLQLSSTDDLCEYLNTLKI